MLIQQQQELVLMLALVACFDRWDSHETSVVFASLFIIGFFQKKSLVLDRRKRGRRLVRRT